jgi:hypothetical protein
VPVQSGFRIDYSRVARTRYQVFAPLRLSPVLVSGQNDVGAVMERGVFSLALEYAVRVIIALIRDPFAQLQASYIRCKSASLELVPLCVRASALLY